MKSPKINAAAEVPHPTTGGSYLYDPVSGGLIRQLVPVAAADGSEPAAPAAAPEPDLKEV